MTAPDVPAWPTNDPTPPVIDVADPTSGDFPEAKSTAPPWLVVPNPTPPGDKPPP